MIPNVPQACIAKSTLLVPIVSEMLMNGPLCSLRLALARADVAPSSRMDRPSLKIPGFAANYYASLIGTE